MVSVVYMSKPLVHSKANQINMLRDTNINMTKVLILKALKSSRESTLDTSYYEINNDVQIINSIISTIRGHPNFS